MEIQWLHSRANNRWAKDRVYRPWKSITEYRWHPKAEEKFVVASSIYENNKMEIYFIYDAESSLILKVGHYGDSPATLILNSISYNLNNEELNIKKLKYYMIEDKEENIDSEVEYKVFFPALEE